MICESFFEIPVGEHLIVSTSYQINIVVVSCRSWNLFRRKEFQFFCSSYYGIRGWFFSFHLLVGVGHKIRCSAPFRLLSAILTRFFIGSLTSLGGIDERFIFVTHAIFFCSQIRRTVPFFTSIWMVCGARPSCLTIFRFDNGRS